MNTSDVKLLIIGAGNMGSAIGLGLLDHTLKSSQLAVVNPSANKLKPFEMLGADTYTDFAEALAIFKPTAVLLAVKPQILPTVVAPIANKLKDLLLISIAAGIKLEKLEDLLKDARVVRVMPNLCVQKMSGAAAVCAGTKATSSDTQLVVELFAALGKAAVMREDQLEVESAAVGCAPAFFALMIDAFTRASIEAGLPARDARELLLATMKGTAMQLLEDGVHPREYMERVTSPGGTTAAALHALEPYMQEGAYEALDAAMRRAEELGA